MVNLYKLIFILLLGITFHSKSQSLVINQTITTFPHTETNVNTNPSNGGQTAAGMAGSCFTLPCCSVKVYKVVLPENGVLRVEWSTYSPLATSLIAYNSLVANPTSFSDLSYISSVPGNFCGFRDTLLLGRAFEGWKNTPYGQTPTTKSGLNSIYDFNAPSHSAGYFPAGDYYVLAFNENQQTTMGVGNNIDITFEFASACPDSTVCTSVDINTCNDYISPSGKTYSVSGTYKDTLIGQALGGYDSLITTRLTINPTPSVVLSIADSISNAALNNGVLSAIANNGTPPYTYSWSTGLTVSENILAFQSFESDSNDTWSYIADPVTYATETDSVIAGSEDIWAVIREFTGSIDTASNGVNFWGCQDLDNSNGGRSSHHTLTFDPIDVSNYTGVKLSFDYYSDGFDSSDDIEYEVVFDSSTTWSSSGTNLGKNNDEWVTVELNVPDSVHFIRLQLRTQQNGSSDYAGYDNIKLIAQNSTISNLSAGFYSVTVSDLNGCSTTGSITIGGTAPTYRDTTSYTSCNQYTWSQNNTLYTSSGFYSDTITTGSADTIKTLNLTINNTTASTDVQVACDTYTWAQNSMTYTATGLYNDTIQNAAGCDSVITLNLTIDSADYTITQNNAVLTANQAGATYQWIDCTNGDTAITGATSQSYTAIINGNYAVVVTLNSCSDTSACSTVVGVGINESYLASSLRIYPNPTTQQIVIENTSTNRINKIIVRNTIGQIVSTVNEINGQKQTIDLIGERGIYFVEVINQNGKSQLFKVIKK